MNFYNPQVKMMFDLYHELNTGECNDNLDGFKKRLGANGIKVINIIIDYLNELEHLDYTYQTIDYLGNDLKILFNKQSKKYILSKNADLLKKTIAAYFMIMALNNHSKQLIIKKTDHNLSWALHYSCLIDNHDFLTLIHEYKQPDNSLVFDLTALNKAYYSITQVSLNYDFLTLKQPL